MENIAYTGNRTERISTAFARDSYVKFQLSNMNKISDDINLTVNQFAICVNFETYLDWLKPDFCKIIMPHTLQIKLVIRVGSPAIVKLKNSNFHTLFKCF